jgi:hypothetical protein
MIDTVSQKSGFGKSRKRCSGSLFTLSNPPLASLLHTHPLLTELVYLFSLPKEKNSPFLPLLPFHLPCRERAAMLMRHYENLFRHSLGPATLYCDTSVVSTDLPVKNWPPYQLEFSAVGISSSERELLLRLVPKDACIYTITFILVVWPGNLHKGRGGCRGFWQSMTYFTSNKLRTTCMVARLRI